MRRLADEEARVTDLTSELGLAQSTASKHLACVRGCALVNVRAPGRAPVYSLPQPELLDLFTSAEEVLAATGNAVAVRSVRARWLGHRGVGGQRPEVYARG